MADVLQPASPLSPSPANVPVPTPRPEGPNDVETVTSNAPKPFSPQELHGKQDDLSEKLDAINKQTGALQPPKSDLPPPPQPKQTSPAEAWGSTAMAFAAIGSLLTRTPLTTALNAAAAGLNAMKKNDLEAAQLNFDQWKTANDLAIKQQNFQLEAYKAALSKASTDERGAVAEFSAYAKAFGDETAYQAAQDRKLQGAHHLVLEHERLGNQLQRDSLKVQESQLQLQALQDMQRSPEWQKASPQDRAVMAQSVTATIDDDTATMLAENRAAGNSQAAVGMGRSPGNLAKYQMALEKVLKSRGATGADLAVADQTYKMISSGMRTLGVTAARIGLGASEVKNLEPQVLKASDELKRTNYPSINAAIQAGEKETGDPALKNLAVRLKALQSSFSQVLTRGGMPTDSVRAATDELMNAKDPDIVLRATIAAMNDEMGAIEKAPGDVARQLNAPLGGKGGGVPHVTSDAQYEALAPGTVYTEDDGRKYTKPLKPRD